MVSTGSGWFKKVNLEGNTESDGTIDLTILYTKSTWKVVDKFRCINVGLLPWSNLVEIDPVLIRRGIVDSHIGSSCQLLQCQKRVHAFPLGPSSLLRMYMISPHSPYDPLY